MTYLANLKQVIQLLAFEMKTSTSKVRFIYKLQVSNYVCNVNNLNKNGLLQFCKYLENFIMFKDKFVKLIRNFIPKLKETQSFT